MLLQMPKKPCALCNAELLVKQTRRQTKHTKAPPQKHHHKNTTTKTPPHKYHQKNTTTAPPHANHCASHAVALSQKRDAVPLITFGLSKKLTTLLEQLMEHFCTAQCASDGRHQWDAARSVPSLRVPYLTGASS